MEKQLYDAALEGNNISLLDLLQEDPVLLDRYVTGRLCETPLHVAATLGHFKFVDEVVTRKPELAQELNSRRSSPLHLAAAKGYLQIVKRLLEVNPDMCLVCDNDGRNPLHIAAMKGHLDVLKELVHAKPWASRSLTEDGETILHACVRCEQLEALKFLVEGILSDDDFVNCQNRDGNTILHLAIASIQTETVNFLISGKKVDVNRVNEDGLTALDLLSQNESDAKEKEMVKSLRRRGATHAKYKPLSNRQLRTVRTKILSSRQPDRSNAVSKPKKRRNRNRKSVVNMESGDWMEKQRNALMVVATVLATMAFQAGINPPSGVWQDDGPSGNYSNGNHTAGWSILADKDPEMYARFLTFNTTAFLASLSIILLLISGLPLKHRFFMWVLMIIMWAAITAMTLVYILSLSALTPDDDFGMIIKIINIAMYSWIGLMFLLLLGHTIRLIIRLIRYLRELRTGLRNIIRIATP